MKDSSAVVNSVIQVSGITGIQYFGLIWAMYPAMFMLGLVILMQTIAAGYFFATKKYPDSTEDQPNLISPGIGMLIASIYMLSSYQILLMGFEIFAGFGFAHSAILFFSHMLRGLN
jgi:hypothetical protein